MNGGGKRGARSASEIAPRSRTNGFRPLDCEATAPNGEVWYALYDSSTNGPWTRWWSLGNRGNAIVDPPAMVAVNGKLEIFVRDSVTQQMLHQEGTCASTTSCDSPQWNTTGWEVLDGPVRPMTFIAGQPTVIVSQPNNQIDVFATGTDNAAHFISGSGYGSMGYALQVLGVGRYQGTYGNWTSLSGGIVVEPGAASWGSDRLDVIAVGSNFQLYHRYSNDNGVTWNPANGNWEGLGGTAYSTPSVTSWGTNRLDAVVRQQTGTIGHISWTPTTSWVWDTIPGSTAVSPVALATGVDVLDVFDSSYGTYAGIATASMTGFGAPATWSTWSPLSGASEAYRVAEVSRQELNGPAIDLVMTGYSSNNDGVHLVHRNEDRHERSGERGTAGSAI